LTGKPSSDWQGFITTSSTGNSWLRRIYSQTCKGKHKRLISWDELREIAINSAGHCAVSGLPFDFTIHSGRRPFAPSLDRIDSSGGYTKGNVRLVCFAVNVALNCWGDEAFLRMCRAVAINQVRNGSV